MAETIWNKQPEPQNHFGTALAALLMLTGVAALSAYAVYEKPPVPAASPKLELSQAVAAFDAGQLAQAAKAFRVLADKGDVRAEYWYGHALDQGLGVKRDVRQALVEFTNAWEGGVPQAGQRLGEIYRDGNQVVQDLLKAREYFREAAMRGDAEAGVELGRMLRDGLGGPPDPVGAYAWFETASLDGNLDARRERDALLPHLTLDQQTAGEQQAAALRSQPASGRSK